jgi:hypothetical protein
MRIITNRDHIKSRRQLGQILFFVGLAIWVGGLLITNLIPQIDVILILVPCIITPLGLGATVYALRLTNEYVKLPHPDEAIIEGLKGTSRRSILYNYLLKPPHVLVTPWGIYTLTTRYQDARVKVHGEKIIDQKAVGPLGPLFLFLRQEGLRKPFEQARREADEVQALVDETLPEANITVQPVVVFVSPRAVLDVENPAIPVVYVDSKRKPSLKSAVRSDRGPDTDDSSDDEGDEAAASSPLPAQGGGKAGKAAKARRAQLEKKQAELDTPSGVISDAQIAKLHRAIMLAATGEHVPADDED